MLPDDEFEREHPSYGILHISRLSGGAKRLFGSPLAAHYGSIRLSVSKGKWIHGLHHRLAASHLAGAKTILANYGGRIDLLRYLTGARKTCPA